MVVPKQATAAWASGQTPKCLLPPKLWELMDGDYYATARAGGGCRQRAFDSAPGPMPPAATDGEGSCLIGLLPGHVWVRATSVTRWLRAADSALKDSPSAEAVGELQ